MDTYILVNKKPVRENNILEWSEWMSRNNIVVKKTQISDGVEVSTVFLGIDHNFYDDDYPIIFETMIFGGARDMETKRYRTWGDAVQGHNETVKEFSQRCAYCSTLRTADEVKCKHCHGGF